MDKNVLLDWKEAHADVYFKFKQDFEGQLQKPYQRTILDSKKIHDLSEGRKCSLYVHEGNLKVTFKRKSIYEIFVNA